MSANILKGPDEGSGIPHESVGKLLLEALKSHKKNIVALIDVKSGEVYTYADLIEVSQNLAWNLRKLGIGKNDIIGIVSENTRKYCVALLAGLYLAAPVHLINPGSTEHELKHLLNLSKPKLVFSSKRCLNNLLKAKNDFDFIERIVLFDDGEESEEFLLYKNLILKYTLFFRVEEDIDVKTHTAVICTSSGITGSPKGVMLTHENLRFHFVHSRGTVFRLKPAECVHLVVPLFDLYGLHLVDAGLYSESTLIILDRFDPKIFLQTIENYKIEQLFLVPTLINFLVNSPLTRQYVLSSIAYIYNAAAPVLEEDFKALSKRFNLRTVHQLYGLAETTGTAVCTPRNGAAPTGSCGKLVPGCLLKIVDVETKQSLGANKNGEICLGGRQIMKGYINDAEKTKEILDSEGFLHTGDVGFYDEEGFVYVVGKIKNIISYKGHQVSPVEIEHILLKHPSVEDVAVVAKPDGRAGEVAVGFIVKKAGAIVSEKDISDYLSELVCAEKRLHGGVQFVHMIPKHIGGEILRKELQKIIQ